MVDHKLRIIVTGVQESSKDGKPAYLPITVAVGGLLVHGTIITEEDYFELHGGDISVYGEAMFDGENEGASLSDYTTSEISSAHPDYIHIKATTIYSGGVNMLPNNDFLLWRGLMSRVDGYFFGSMAES